MAKEGVINSLASQGRWDKIRAMYPVGSHEPGYEYAQQVLQAEENRIAREAAEAAGRTHEAKLARGPAPREAASNDVIDRLRKMGIPEKDLRDAGAAYSNLIDAYGNHPTLTPQELLQEMESRGYHADEIKRMQPFFDRVKPVVDADLGISNPTTTFPDEISRRNYLIANHFSDAEIQDIDRGTLFNGSNTKYTIPDTARAKLEEQDFKHQRGRVKRSAEQKNREVLDKIVQDYNEHTMPESSREKHAMEIGAAGSHLLAHAASQGAFKYKGKRLADETADEKAAEVLLRDMNPNTRESLSRKKTLEDVTSRNFGKDAAQKAAAPYMSKASADFAKRHNDLFGDIETAHEKSLYDQGIRNWEDKIAPSIKAKYLTPGVRGHGHVAKEVGEAAEKTMRGVNEAIIGQRAQNRAASMGATLSEQANQANLAGQAANLTQADIDADLKATEALEGIHARHRGERRQHAADIGQLGENKADRAQKEINAAIKEAEAEHGHAERIGRVLADVGNANPVSEFKKEETLEKPKRTGMQSTASGLMGLGAGMLGKKAGGRVKKAIGGTVSPISHSKYVTPHAMISYLQAKSSHQRLATGGAVDPNFIQDAVFDGVLPSTELRQQVRRQVLGQAKEDYDAKSRNHLATGGAVNPIMEGASLAKHFVEKERMKILNPAPEKEESMFSRGLKGFMAGAAASGNNDWVARSGRSFTGAVAADDAAKEAKRQRDKEHKKLIMEVGKQYADERNAEREFGLHERKHELAEKGMGLHEKEVNAKIGHWTALGNAMKAQQGLGDVAKTLTADQRKAKKEALENIKTGIKIKRDVAQGHELLGKVETGPVSGFLSNHLGSFGQGLAGLFTKGDITERQGINRVGGSLFLGAHQSMKNIPRSSEFAKRIEDIKLNASNTPEANREALGMNEELAHDSIATGREALKDLGYSDDEIDNIQEMYAREGGKKTPSHNVDYATSGDKQAKIAALKAERAALMKGTS